MIGGQVSRKIARLRFHLAAEFGEFLPDRARITANFLRRRTRNRHNGDEHPVGQRATIVKHDSAVLYCTLISHC